MNIHPLGDRVLVKPIKQDEVTKSGIVLPDNAQEKSQEGEILAVGIGKIIDGKLRPLEIKKGERVLYSKYSGDEIHIDNEELKIISESDILAIIK